MAEIEAAITTQAPWGDSPLPWQQGLWEGLIAPRLRQGDMPHALLILGVRGLGKSHFARLLAAALLCEARGGAGLPCGACRGCRLRLAGAHPDLNMVETGEGGRGGIGVDQIRALTERVWLSSQYGGARIGIVDPADRMTLSAANSLLKTLEEAPERAVLVLVADRPNRLPATIRSRCQILKLTAPDAAEAGSWLRAQAGGEQAPALLPLTAGAPLAALELARENAGEAMTGLMTALEAIASGRLSPVEAAAPWAGRGDAGRLLDWTDALVTDLARSQVAGTEWLRIWDPVRIQSFAKRLSSTSLQEFLLWLAETRRAAEQPLNDQLVAESLFVRWRRAVRSG